MATEFCPCCHRAMPHSTREGTALTPLKASMFDFIDRHPGLSAAEIGVALGRSEHNVRVTVSQMNAAFDGSGVKVQGARGWGYRVYRRRAAA